MPATSMKVNTNRSDGGSGIGIVPCREGRRAVAWSGRWSGSRGRCGGAGFTLVELLVTIAIVVILAALTVLAVRHGKASARSARSVSNLRQIGTAMHGYTAENGGRFPITWGSQVDGGPKLLWAQEIAPGLSGDERRPRGAGTLAIVEYLQPIFTSPTTLKPGKINRERPWLDSTYSMNGNLNVRELGLNRGISMASVPRPSGTVMVVDGGQWADGSQADANIGKVWTETRNSKQPDKLVTVTEPRPDGLYGWGTIAYRDRGTAATLWIDGHVTRVKKGRFKHRDFKP